MRQYSSKDIGIDIAQVEASLAENRGFPIHTFHDPAVYEFELQAIFHKTWQYFAPLDKLSEPGSVVSGVVGRIPVAVTRARDGKLYGFVNVCRHRGFPVVEGEKKCNLLTCRYHSWSYNLDGSLAAAPFTQNDAGFDKSKFGLLPIRVDTWAQGVFVNADSNAPALRGALPALDKWTDEKGFLLGRDDYTFYRQMIIDQNSNWKLWYDNETECYHCATIHDDSFNKAFNTFDGDAIMHEVRGSMLSMHFPGLEVAEEAAGDHLSTKTYRSFQFFPGCQLTQHDDLMLMGKMTPTGPQSCRWTIDYLMQKGSDPARVDRWIDIWTQTFREDADVTTIQQSSLLNDRAVPFRFVPNRERMSQSIHHLIWQAYKANLVDHAV
jgi:phenylpropionate dioxygenase-like ring-hydroxylating dioxygenase large terminal subunit